MSAISAVATPMVQARVAKKAAPAQARSVTAAKFGVIDPFNNLHNETFSYLPPLTDAQISKQVEYLVANGWTPCLEFSAVGYTKSERMVDAFMGSGYYDNRYWSMYKLPMYGAVTAAEVLAEVANCKKEYPGSWVRLLGFDANKQVQCTSMMVAKGSN